MSSSSLGPMSDWRTQAQVDADQALHAALCQVLDAYSDGSEEDKGFMLTEYVIITARSGITDDNAQRVQYGYTFSNGSVPWHSVMGLLDWARLALREQMKERQEG